MYHISRMNSITCVYIISDIHNVYHIWTTELTFETFCSRCSAPRNTYTTASPTRTNSEKKKSSRVSMYYISYTNSRADFCRHFASKSRAPRSAVCVCLKYCNTLQHTAIHYNTLQHAKGTCKEHMRNCPTHTTTSQKSARYSIYFTSNPNCTADFPRHFASRSRTPRSVCLSAPPTHCRRHGCDAHGTQHARATNASW